MGHLHIPILFPPLLNKDTFHSLRDSGYNISFKTNQKTKFTYANFSSNLIQLETMTKKISTFFLTNWINPVDALDEVFCSYDIVNGTHLLYP